MRQTFFADREVPGIMVTNSKFYEAEVEAAGRIAENLPIKHESLHSEVTLQEKLKGTTGVITPKSVVSFPIIAFEGRSIKPLVHILSRCCQ